MNSGTPTVQFAIRQNLNEISMSWQALLLRFDCATVRIEGDFEFRSSHLGANFSLDLDDHLQEKSPIASLWHLAAGEGALVRAGEESFEVAFPCGCVLAAPRTRFPETVKLFDSRRPCVMARYPTDVLAPGFEWKD